MPKKCVRSMSCDLKISFVAIITGLIFLHVTMMGEDFLSGFGFRPENVFLQNGAFLI